MMKKIKSAPNRQIILLSSLALAATAMLLLVILPSTSEARTTRPYPPASQQFTCKCTREYAPVCGLDGRTYPNACNARCAGVAIVHAGQCSVAKPTPTKKPFATPVILPIQPAPISPAYPVILPTPMPPPISPPHHHTPRPPATNCLCPEVYAPVCGIDGITYSNFCKASCLGTPIAHGGTCFFQHHFTSFRPWSFQSWFVNPFTAYQSSWTGTSYLR